MSSHSHKFFTKISSNQTSSNTLSHHDFQLELKDYTNIDLRSCSLIPIRSRYYYLIYSTRRFNILTRHHLCTLIAGEITCEKLNQEVCAFAVSSSGNRCVLEKRVKIRTGGQERYVCMTSEIEANEQLKNTIETDFCIESCGLDRKTVGISSDSLLDSSFQNKLCSTDCAESCPNVYDLYFNLAAGEGIKNLN